MFGQNYEFPAIVIHLKVNPIKWNKLKFSISLGFFLTYSSYL